MITLLAILSGAINYNNSLAYLLCFFLASLGFVSMLQTHQNLNRLVIHAKHSAAVFCGSPVHFVFDVYTTAHHSHIALQTAVNNTVFSVKADQHTRIVLTEISAKRGRQFISRFKLYSEYPLGLFHAWTQVQIKNQAIIYPKPLADSVSYERYFTGNNRQSPFTGEDEFSGIRDFREGDKPRSLAWKTIAKTGKLYTKEFHRESGDTQLFDYYKLSHISNKETRLSILCGLVLKASQMNTDYGLKLPAKTIAPGSGEQHKQHCLTTLALAKL